VSVLGLAQHGSLAPPLMRRQFWGLALDRLRFWEILQAVLFRCRKRRVVGMA
jgi:hypothetical protein